MLSAGLKSKINSLWDKFWSRGISNPITAIEQISYLLFMRRLDENDLNALEEKKDYQTIFRELVLDEKGKPVKDKSGAIIYESREDYRWSKFKELDAEAMLDLVSNKVFTFIKELNDKDQPFARYMKNASFDINNAKLLEEAVEAIDEIYKEIEEQLEEGQQFQDTQGDVYEYLLSEMSTSGKNGQFRTPRHLVQFMCEILDPNLNDKICDPACGTGGFLVGAYQHILTKHTSKEEKTKDENGFDRFKKSGGDLINDEVKLKKLKENTLFGFDVDQNMIRIGLMNLMLHGITIPKIENTDTLSKKYDEDYKDGQYTKILANPPFTGRVDKDGMSDSLRIPGAQTELLFLSRISKMLRKNGKAAVIIPEGVLFGSSKAQAKAREILLKDNKLDAVISLPSGAFKPYTGVKTSILLFTKVEDESETWHTKKVWFYELQSDGYSLDDNRIRLKDHPLPEARTAYDTKDENLKTDRKTHFFVSIAEIKNNDLDLSFNRYKEFEYEEQTYDPPKEILTKLIKMEEEILADMNELKGLIG